MPTSIYVDIDSEGFATASVRIPERTMNVLTPEFVANLSALLDRVVSDDAVRGVILTAEGKTFMAGADLKELVEKYDQAVAPDAAFEFSHALSRVFRRMETCGKPFVAAINGIALGGGLELCLACHYRVLADAPTAVVGLSEVKLGLLPGAGGTQRTTRLLGVEKALPLLLEGTHLKSAEALTEVSRRAELALGTEAILASNTSTLPITGLARAITRPANFIGIHFFSPVEKMALVEVIVGEMTSEQTVARALDYVAQLKKTPIVVKDGRGFYANRIFGSYVYEGMAMLAEGIAPALIENAACMAGMPMGPLAVSDEVTLELQWKVVQHTERDLGDSFSKPLGYDVLHKLVVELQRPGKRYGKGFYDYPQDAPKRLWSGLRNHYPLLVEQPDVAEVKRRLLHVQALEAARCLEEGVIAHPADADLGSVLGCGFPAYTGGVLSYIDTVGLRRFVAECAELARCHGSRFEPSEWLSARATAGENFYQATKLTIAA